MDSSRFDDLDRATSRLLDRLRDRLPDVATALTVGQDPPEEWAIKVKLHEVLVPLMVTVVALSDCLQELRATVAGG